MAVFHTLVRVGCKLHEWYNPFVKVRLQSIFKNTFKQFCTHKKKGSRTEFRNLVVFVIIVIKLNTANTRKNKINQVAE